MRYQHRTRVADPGQSADQLVMEADTAMYAAKAQPDSSIKVFEPALLYARRLQSVMITELREAILQDQLTLHYQPVVDLATGGLKALRRWCAGPPGARPADARPSSRWPKRPG